MHTFDSKISSLHCPCCRFDRVGSQVYSTFPSYGKSNSGNTQCKGSPLHQRYYRINLEYGIQELSPLLLNSFCLEGSFLSASFQHTLLWSNLARNWECRPSISHLQSQNKMETEDIYERFSPRPLPLEKNLLHFLFFNLSQARFPLKN